MYGEPMPIMPYHGDWIIGIIILSVILFTVAQVSAKTFYAAVVRFFLFNELMDDENKTTKLFRWNAVLLNISSLFIISVFAYFAVSYTNAIPNSSGFAIWLFSLVVITIALALRHFVCATTGSVSDTAKIFNDYIITVYQAYRFAGFFLFFVMVLFFYTPLINAKICFITGFITIAITYLIRALRLFLLFMTNKISIFYLILYLCALEILPVLISIKFFSGLM
jgi:hypothetical protein